MLSRRLSWFARSLGVVNSKKGQDHYNKTIRVVMQSHLQPSANRYVLTASAASRTTNTAFHISFLLTRRRWESFLRFTAAAHPVHQRYRTQGGGPDTDADSGFAAVSRDSGLGYTMHPLRVGKRHADPGKGKYHTPAVSTRVSANGVSEEEMLPQGPRHVSRASRTEPLSIG